MREKAKPKSYKNIMILLCILVLGTCGLEGQNLDSLAVHALNFSGHRLRQTVADLGDTVKFPRSTQPNGQWKTTAGNEWTSGFFPGCLWYMFEYTKDPFFKKAAQRWTEGLEEQQFNARTHDIGFIIFGSHGNEYRLDPSDKSRSIVLQAARTLMKRFNPFVGCVKSWDGRKRWAYPVIIDNMMNLELLLWSSQYDTTGLMRKMAVSHAEKTMKNHFRPDGSTYHVVAYDTATGLVLAKNTHQGLADESVWSRGQAWAIYGFTMVYRYTKNDRFLNTAERAADYFISHLPPDLIPFWDFQVQDKLTEPRDVSAASIAASALLELSGFTTNQDKKNKYRSVAEGILTSLARSPYLAEGTNSSGILNHAVGSRPAGSEVDVSLIYGDYYFIEAMMRYRASLNRGN